MNFIPNKGGKYRLATHLGVLYFSWNDHPVDTEIGRSTGVFPYTPYGEELADWQHAFLRKLGTSNKFWEWVDDYELHT